jgi:SAM-dependent methyltransferase
VPAGPDWSHASRQFAEVVRRYSTAQGLRPDAPNVVSTVRTNTDLVPARAAILLRLLEHFGEPSSLAGRRVLEVGCGFGALASFLFIEQDPAELVAVDVREDYVATATEVVADTGLDAARLRFQVGDMRSLSSSFAERFDVVLVNNAFIYLPTRHDMEAGMRSLAGSLAPGGTLVMYHANRWALREPFTGDPIVHLLPPGLAERVSSLTGWQHNHGRVRLLSPPAQRRLLQRAGLHDVHVAAVNGDRVLTGRAAVRSRYFATVARRSGA